MTPSRGLPRLVIGTGIPREVGTLVGGAAVVKKGSEARMKPREKYISSSTRSNRGHNWGFYTSWRT